MNGNNLYPWQSDILKLINSKIEERQIYWFIDRLGGCGKTTLCKNIMLNFDEVLVSNILNEKLKDLIHDYVKLGDSSPKAIIIDRAFCKYNSVNYGILEEIKNGCYYTEKTESEILTYNVPHVIIFSDREPDYTQMRPNKFKVFEIHENIIKEYKRTIF